MEAVSRRPALLIGLVLLVAARSAGAQDGKVDPQRATPPRILIDRPADFSTYAGSVTVAGTIRPGDSGAAVLRAWWKTLGTSLRGEIAWSEDGRFAFGFDPPADRVGDRKSVV